MKIYFYNSYGNSPTGFQFSVFSTTDRNLKMIYSSDIDSKYVRSVFCNAGALCALGKADNSTKYFVIKNIEFENDDGRRWYVNLALESDANSDKEFDTSVFNILTGYADFKAVLKDALFVSEDTELSYGIDSVAVDEYFYSGKKADISDSEFWKSSNATIKKFRYMVETFNGAGNGIYFLSYEGTIKYFYSNNDELKDMPIRFPLDSKKFNALLEKDEESLSSYEERENVEKSADIISNMKKYIPDMKTALKVAGGTIIAIGGAYVLIDGAVKLSKIIRR